MSLMAIVALIVAGVLFVIAEIFVPGGFVGGIGVVLLIAGIICGFIEDPTLGLGLLLGSLVFGCFALWFWIKFMSYSPFGKKIIHQGDAGTWHSFDGAQSGLAGKQGIAKTPLHPGGIATIDGKRVDVVTRGERVAAGASIRVLKVEGNRVVVAEAAQDEAEPEAST